MRKKLCPLIFPHVLAQGIDRPEAEHLSMCNGEKCEWFLMRSGLQEDRCSIPVMAMFIEAMGWKTLKTNKLKRKVEQWKEREDAERAKVSHENVKSLMKRLKHAK